MPLVTTPPTVAGPADMKLIEDTTGHSCTVPDLRHRDLVFETSKARYEIRYYPDARKGMQWGTMYNLTTGRKVSHSSARGSRVLAAARARVAEGRTP